MRDPAERQRIRDGIAARYAARPAQARQATAVSLPEPADDGDHVYLYFLEAVGWDLVKIGRSRSVWRRVGQIQVSCPFEVKLVGLAICHGDGYETESAAHTRFRADRVYGEWFRLSPELREFIAQFRIKTLADLLSEPK